MKTNRYAILEAAERLEPETRRRRIDPWDIFEAAVLFGPSVADQIRKDYWARFRAWAGFSMIAQAEALLPSRSDVAGFTEWAFRRLGIRGEQ